MKVQKAPPPVRKRTIYSTDNAKIVLTCADADAAARAVKRAPNPQAAIGAAAVVRRLATYPTADPYDRAHSQMRHGMLVPLDEQDRGFSGGKPRRYHDGQMTVDLRGRRVAWDSAYDGCEAARRRMEKAGIQLSPSVTMAAMVRGAMAMTPQNYRRVRDLIQQPTRQRMTPEERAMERAASSLLRRASRG